MDNFAVLQLNTRDHALYIPSYIVDRSVPLEAHVQQVRLLSSHRDLLVQRRERFLQRGLELGLEYSIERRYCHFPELITMLHLEEFVIYTFNPAKEASTCLHTTSFRISQSALGISQSVFMRIRQAHRIARRDDILDVEAGCC